MDLACGLDHFLRPDGFVADERDVMFMEFVGSSTAHRAWKYFAANSVFADVEHTRIAGQRRLKQKVVDSRPDLGSEIEERRHACSECLSGRCWREGLLNWERGHDKQLALYA